MKQKNSSSPNPKEIVGQTPASMLEMDTSKKLYLDEIELKDQGC